MWKKIPKLIIREAIKEESEFDRKISYSKGTLLNIVINYAKRKEKTGDIPYKNLDWDRLYCFLRNDNEIPIKKDLLDGLMKSIEFDPLLTKEERFDYILETLYHNNYYWWKYDKDTESYVHINSLKTYERVYRIKLIWLLKETQKQLTLDLVIGAKIPSQMSDDERKNALKYMRQLTYKLPDILKRKRYKKEDESEVIK